MVHPGAFDDQERELLLPILPRDDTEDEKLHWRPEPGGRDEQQEDVRCLWSGHGNCQFKVSSVEE